MVKFNTKSILTPDPSSPITTARYQILGGEVFAFGLPGQGGINPGGTLDAQSRVILGQSQGKTLVIEVKYQGPDKVTRIATYTGKVR